MRFLFCLLFAFTANAAVTFKASHREAANRFDALDCASNWWEGFCNDRGAYREAWEKRFGVSKKDQEQFTRYMELRKKYYKEIDASPTAPEHNQNGIFARVGAALEDPVAQAFYSSATMEDAWSKVAGFMDAADVEALKANHAYFEKNLAKIVKESKPFLKASEKLSTDLAKPEYAPFVDKLAAFYGVGEPVNFEVIYNWWPPITSDNASAAGNVLVLRKNPGLHMSAPDLEVVFHEVVHVISAQQPLSQKRVLTDLFLKECAISGKVDRNKILEEPLAVALGQLYFFETFHPERLKLEDNQYNDPWVNAFSKMIYPLVRAEVVAGKKITDGIVPKLGKLCKDLWALKGK